MAQQTPETSGWRSTPRQSSSHRNVAVFKIPLARTTVCPGEWLPFYTLEEEETFSASLAEVSWDQIFGTCSFLVQSLERRQL